MKNSHLFRMQNKFQEILGADVLELCVRLGDAAAKHGVSAYLVGGPVRDVLLGVRSDDLDFMIDGNAPDFLSQLYANWAYDFSEFPAPKKPVVFRRYRTAKLRFDTPICDRFYELDFSSSRTEQYPTPGGRPEVQAGDLKEDLRRRDFSVNAMAVSLSGETLFDIVDYHEGQRHLEEGLLAILHENSFRDDPARMLRGLRFSVRFGFEWEPRTAELFQEAKSKDFLSLLPPARLFDEYRKALCDTAADLIVARFSKEGILAQINEGFSFTETYAETLSSDVDLLSESFPEEMQLWQLRFVLLADSLAEEHFEEMLRRFEINKTMQDSLLTARRWWKARNAV